ncbi:hypothetical protein TNIN_340391 [Trichonephila inaurata madagascariensis]|uniref:Uncharacterized protein n=1 Tax=Trichonephila inaurata madagascariensis TaxID=2747483 RepID=A0A8X6XBR4_9ARAC|nr:hypothetical protein TNIN_340391 [Trichonephila inaurata madagascariensis]
MLTHKQNRFCFFAPVNSPIKNFQTTPTNDSRNINPCKGKDNSNLEYPPQRKNARKLILDLPTSQQISIITDKFTLPQNATVYNIGNPGNVAQENNPPAPRTTGTDSGARTSANQNTAQNQLPPPIMLFVPDNYRSQMAAITKEFPKRRSRLTGDFFKLYADNHDECRELVQLPKRIIF